MAHYIDADRLRAEIEKTYKSEIQPWLSGVSATSAIYDYVLPLIDSIESEKSVPIDLEEAAGEYEKKHTYQRYDGGGLTPEYDATLAEAFISGAKWMKEQMLKGAKDGYVSAIIILNDGDEEHYAVTYPNGERPHSITDKVKIIIL